MNPRPHEKSTRVLSELAKVFGVDVNSFDEDKWSAAITAAGAIDTVVDVDHNYNSGYYFEQVINGNSMPYMTDEEANFIRSTYEGLSDTSKKHWQTAASKLGAFALRRLQATDIDEYLGVIVEESPLMANVLSIENDDSRHDHLQRKSYNTWMHPMIKSMFMFDTLTDVIKDYNEGNMSIPVTPKIVGKLGWCAVNEMVHLVRISPPSVFPIFLTRSVTKIREKTSKEGFWSSQFLRKNSLNM